jgi:magnesium chelatase subunit D
LARILFIHRLKPFLGKNKLEQLLPQREVFMTCFPFTAIVGQEEMKTALILNAVNPLLGGVLICGQKGTAKSTTVRSLASLLPEIEVVDGCVFRCDPKDTASLCNDCRQKMAAGQTLPRTREKMRVVDLPLGATEDRVIGTLDMEHAIKKGKTRFQPGVLAEANRGILYVDEVNLLDDHLVDILLDVAVSEVNIVERESISFTHPAKFILVGTMNPEEGELRPQLLDRFGLCVHVAGLDDVGLRAKVIQRCVDFETASTHFAGAWKDKEKALRETILNARKMLPKVLCPEEKYELAAQVALEFGVDGHRTDLFLIKTARTLAASEGRAEVASADIQRAAPLVLRHRMKKRPTTSEHDETNSLLKTLGAGEENASCPECHETGGTQSSGPRRRHQKCECDQALFGAEEPYRVKHLSVVPGKTEHPRSGRRSNTEAHGGSGKHIGSMMSKHPTTDIAFGATFRAAAPHQIHRDSGNLALAIEYPDIRQKRRSKRVAHTILFLVDASGSMGAKERMVQTKGAILSLLDDAYKRRDRVGMVTFKGGQARVILPPTSDKEKAKQLLKALPVGGRTPLSKGLAVGREAFRKYALKMKNEALLLVVISDGKANVTMKPSESLKHVQEDALAQYRYGGGTDGPSMHDIVSSHALEEALEVAEEIRRAGISSVVIDTAVSGRRDRMKKLSTALGGRYFGIEELRAQELVDIVGASLHNPNVVIGSWLQ